MRIILSFLILVSLLGCQKQAEPTLPYGLVGTYEGVSTTPSFVFKYVFPDYKIFQETSTATITETASGLYTINFKLTGLARMSAASTALPYSFEATLNVLKQENSTPYNGLTVEGTYQSILPQHPNIGNAAKYITGQMKFIDNQLEGELAVIYGEIGQPHDLVNIANFNLKRVK